MIKLERIHVKNYKNIAEADLPLGQMNVVVGENNAGKSNLLEVIPLLNHLIYGPVNEIKSGFLMGGFFKNFNSIADVKYPIIRSLLGLRLEFSDSDLLYSYNLELESLPKDEADFLTILSISKESLFYKPRNKTGKAIRIFERKKNKVEYGEGIKKIEIIENIEDHVSVINLLSIISRSKNILDEYKQAINALRMIIASDIFYFSPHLLKDRNATFDNKSRLAHYDISAAIAHMKFIQEDWEAFKLALSSILNISQVEIHHISQGTDNRQQPFIVFKQNNRYDDLNTMSDGTVVLIALITKLFSDASDIFFLEEPENSIHPRALSELMKLIRAKSLDKQFIITTHSPYLLNMIKPEEVYVASINKEGKSEIGKLPNVKAIKKKLAKDFMNVGDIIFSEPDTDEDSE